MKIKGAVVLVAILLVALLTASAPTAGVRGVPHPVRGGGHPLPGPREGPRRSQPVVERSSIWQEISKGMYRIPARRRAWKSRPRQR